MRFIGATLVHIVSSAAVGFAIGLTFYSRFTNKLLTVFLGLIAAISIHAAFNISIVNAASNDILKVFAWIWGAVIILIILFEEVKAVRPRYIRER